MIIVIMKLIVSLIAGALSGFLIYIALHLLFISDTDDNLDWFVPVTFFGGWIISTYLLLRGARTVSKVISRSFLLGSAEWFAIIPVGVIMGGRALIETTDDYSSSFEMAGATIGAGLITFLTGGFAIVMIFVCLLGYVITLLMAREMKSE